MGIILGTSFYFADDANATCINYIESQTIAAAYEGDTVPTVYTMDTCSGDDISYQIPIATTITFDGIQYDQIYATTNSVITFGNADNTYWDYPNTPSISLYSMDWYAGYGTATDGLDISYSEGGFQINLQVIPYGQWGAEASNINILVAITNTGGISVAYSYQGPEYSNLRTGVRLHDGSIVSLEAWGATYIEPGSTTPTLQPEPVIDPTASPSPIVISQQEVADAAQTASDISNINNLIANINGDPEPTPLPTPSPTETQNPDVIVIEPEIITPDDPRVPDNIDEQTQPDSSNPSPSPETTIEPTPSSEPSVKPSPQPTDKPQDPVVQPTQDPVVVSDIKTYINTSTMGISEDEAKKLVALAAENKNLAVAIEQFNDRAKENATNVLPYTLADATTEVQAETFISDPLGAVFNVNPKELLSNFSELGNDMTQDQREKAQEVIIPVIIASQVIAGMTRRIK